MVRACDFCRGGEEQRPGAWPAGQCRTLTEGHFWEDKALKFVHNDNLESPSKREITFKKYFLGN